MLDQIVLHIGHQKTGTSSLQETLRVNAALLRRHGVHYDDRVPNHHFLPKVVSGRTENPREVRELKAFLRRLKRSNAPRALISAEALCVLSPPHIEAVLSLLSPLARRVTALVYVRHPVPFANSAVSQAMRTMRFSLAEVVARPNVLPLPAILGRWAAALCEDALTVRPFERAAMVNGDIVDDVLATLGLSQLSREIVRVRTNEGLSALAVHLLDRARALYPDYRPPLYSLSAFHEIRGPQYVLPFSAQEDARRRGAESLGALRRDYDIELPDRVLTPSDPPALSRKELDSLATTLMQLTQYATAVEHSYLGRRLATQAPFTEAHYRPTSRLAPLSARLGLTAYLEGVQGNPHRSDPRLGPPVAADRCDRDRGDVSFEAPGAESGFRA